jgi:hypothetical protein
MIVSFKFTKGQDDLTGYAVLRVKLGCVVDLTYEGYFSLQTHAQEKLDSMREDALRTLRLLKDLDVPDDAERVGKKRVAASIDPMSQILRDT